MPDLVDDHPDQEPFCGTRVCSAAIFLQLGAGSVEGDHGVFHPAGRPVNGLCDRVGVGKGETGIHFKRVDHRLGRKFRPKWLTFFWVKRHRHNKRRLRIVLPVTLCIPDELARRGERKVTHITRREMPGPGAAITLRLIFQCFIGRDDINGVLRVTGLFQTLPLNIAQHLAGVFQFTGG